MQFKALIALSLAAVAVAAPGGANPPPTHPPPTHPPPTHPPTPTPPTPTPPTPTPPTPTPPTPTPPTPTPPTPTPPTPIPASQCNTGPVQCCNSVQSAGAPAVATLLGLLGIVVQDVNVPVGVTCSPISIIGLPGNSCSAQAVCCSNNTFNGVVAIGCTPVNLNL